MKKISVILLLLGACAVFQTLPPTLKEDSKQIQETKTALIEDRPGAIERAISELDRCDARNIENAQEIKRLGEELNRCNVASEKKDVQLTKVSKEAGKGEGIRWTYYAVLGFGIFLLIILVLVVAAILALRRNGLPIVSSLLGGRNS
ncbi:hypothetical protein LEP1GSC013_3525 [Leptospira interrogans serovar Valbuzzi str. Duyster]|uniref:hypothetical protein n=1 Tax=Leptospira interrogans TaxID=173 RepID=UPI0002BB3382|nr:hypothetical protein [Leptospira interrogans]EMJ52029.1 hypothetical protein LEP1GSC013_1002 [Leptospira interrogans serovar Valbuzzi str. Duyster]EMJ53667.1 hypothetical protein LEP1GSC013_1741 [Leptospira interrogans serovar Valbuzzi str. Duyster]EMJ54795.1 hypothetical protein LEP1GSC013_2496 [Leptospira interrogans serovar Valbuzzi str. Duyster]EMJ54802.1 hypothetical protein LEP1GSC013_2539 [Leptospira interrogans serovar Valbuzzi str. Duyster]EMJ55419.1 hypothetical protein LEP1GSC013